MFGGHLFSSSIDHVRRWAAAALLRLARTILAGTLKMLRQRTIGRVETPILVAMERGAERLAAAVLFGAKRPLHRKRRIGGGLS
jgi:hypothetical protein